MVCVTDQLSASQLIRSVPDLAQRLDGRAGHASEPLNRMGRAVQASPSGSYVLELFLQHIGQGPRREELSLVIDPNQVHQVTLQIRL